MGGGVAVNRPAFRHITLAWLMCLPTIISLSANSRGLPLMMLGAISMALVVWSLAWLLSNRWRLVAWIVSRPRIADAIIQYAVRRNVCLHIPDKGPRHAAYMERRWVFNVPITQDKRPKWLRPPFEIRVHHIKRADADRDMHDHPWNWRTIILRGWYDEETDKGEFERRYPGDTSGRRVADAHWIRGVSVGGVWTLFIVGPYRQKWGFKTTNGKVPYDQYDRLTDV